MQIRVLVRQIVSRQREEDTDIAVEFIRPFEPRFRRHFAGIIGGLHPVHDRDALFDRVVWHLRARREFTIAAAAVSRRPAAFDADIAGKSRQQRRTAGGTLATVVSLRPPALNQRRRFGVSVIPRQLANRLCRNTGDLFRPLRGFDLTVFIPHQVSHQRLVGGHAFRHGGLVEAQGIAFDKGFIVQVFTDDDVHHRVHQGVVGGGQQRDPLIGQRRHGIGITRIDDDKASTVLFHLLKIVVGVAEDGFGRVVSPEDHQLRVGQGIQRVTAGGRAVGIGRRGGSVAHAHRVVILQIASGEIEQTTHHFIAGKGAPAGGGIVVHKAARRAIFGGDALQVVGDKRGGFFPGDAFKLPLPPFADALHRIFQTIRVIDKLAIAPAAHAGAHHRHLRIERAIRASGDLCHHAVRDVGANIAFTATVEGAAGLDDAFCALRGRLRRTGSGFRGHCFTGHDKGQRHQG